MIVENYEKVFTNDGSDNIIKKNYNPLNKDCKIFESEGLFMDKEIESNLNWKEKVIVKLFHKTFNKVRISIVNAMLK